MVSVAFAAGLTGLRDFDTFHHLALGRELLRSGFPAEDPFLFPLEGLHVGLMPYWLGSLVIYLSQLAAGDAGPVLLSGVMGALLFLVLFLDSRREGESWLGFAVSLALLAVAVPVFSLRAVARPELFANLLLALTLLAVRRWESGRGRELLLFPVVALVWTNLHPSFVLGLAVVGAWVAVEGGRTAWLRLRAEAAPGGRRLAAGALVLFAGMACGMANPSPFKPVLSAVGLGLAALGIPTRGVGTSLQFEAVLPYLRHFITELRPLEATDLTEPIGVLLLLTAASFGAAGRRASPREVLTFLAFVVAALPARRFIGVAAVVAAPIAARNLADAAERLGRRWPRSRLGLAAALAPVLVFSAWAAAASAQTSFGTRFHANLFPVAATAYLEERGLDGKIFNTFHFGGWLEWKLDRKVFQDGRALLRPEDIEPSIGEAADYAPFAELDARYRFDALVVGYVGVDPARLAALGRSRGGADLAADRTLWSLVAFDDGGMLYLRRDGAHAALAASDEYRFVLPANFLEFDRLRDPIVADGMRLDLERAVAASPACRLCNRLLGFVYLAARNSSDAERAFTAALGGSREERQLAMLGLGESAELAGDLARARTRYRDALGPGPQAPRARRALARVELNAGAPALAVPYLEENLRGDRQERDDLALLAVARRRLGDETAAAALDERVSTVDRVKQAEAFYLRGLELSQANDPSGAASAYLASLALNDANAAAHSNLGYLYLDAGDLAGAVREQRRALQLRPGSPEAHFGLGLALKGLGERVEAAREFRAYLSFQPRGYWSLKAEEHARELEALP